MDIGNFLVSIVSGMAICIPLLVKLVQYVGKAMKEKNWSRLVSLVLCLMQEAEDMFDDGLTKREWVQRMTRAGAKSIGCEIDDNELGELIDAMCGMSKHVNAA